MSSGSHPGIACLFFFLPDITDTSPTAEENKEEAWPARKDTTLDPSQIKNMPSLSAIQHMFTKHQLCAMPWSILQLPPQNPSPQSPFQGASPSLRRGKGTPHLQSPRKWQTISWEAKKSKCLQAFYRQKLKFYLRTLIDIWVSFNFLKQWSILLIFFQWCKSIQLPSIWKQAFGVRVSSKQFTSTWPVRQRSAQKMAWGILPKLGVTKTGAPGGERWVGWDDSSGQEDLMDEMGFERCLERRGRVWLHRTVLGEYSRHAREGGKSRKGGKNWGQRRQMRYFPILPWDTPWAECLWRAAGYCGPMGIVS